MFFSKKKSILGVDIGTAYIKIAQITHDRQPVLDTYGIVNAAFPLNGKDDRSIEKMAEALQTLVARAGVTTKYCVVSFPATTVFTSVIELPTMSDQELSGAVEYEAKKYVPLALSEIDLAWDILHRESKGSNATMKVLLTAVPKQVGENYRKLFELAKLEAAVGDIEAQALIRSLIGGAPINCVILDIGAKGTAINIVENGILRLSRNLNVGGETITTKIADALRISLPRAEQFKKDFGVSNSTFVPQTIEPVLSLMKSETKQLMAIYQSQTVKVDKLILVGGGASLPGISHYFSDLGIPVELGNPLRAVAYGKNMEQLLSRYSLNLSVAIGLGLRAE